MIITGGPIDQVDNSRSIIVPVWEIISPSSDVIDITEDVHSIPPFYEPTLDMDKIVASFFNPVTGEFNNTAFEEYIIGKFNLSEF